VNFIDYLETNLSTSRVSGGSQVLINDDCPFCGGSGRMYVDVRKQVGICFKCGQGFGGIRFVMAHENVSKAKAAGILEGFDGRYVSERDEEEPKQELWWPQCEPLPVEAVAYLGERGFTLPFCQSMRFSFCSVDTVVGGKAYRTANRVIIPIFDRRGNAVGWQGRDITGKSRIKYLLQPGFDAKSSLYNIQAIAEGVPVVVVEGVMDACGWIRSGYTNVVATWGKKISDEQLLMLFHLNPPIVYMAWDGDAADKKYEFAEKFGHLFDVRIVDMGEKDADELDGEGLKLLLKDASAYSWEMKIMSALKI